MVDVCEQMEDMHDSRPLILARRLTVLEQSDPAARPLRCPGGGRDGSLIDGRMAKAGSKSQEAIASSVGPARLLSGIQRRPCRSPIACRAYDRIDRDRDAGCKANRPPEMCVVRRGSQFPSNSRREVARRGVSGRGKPHPALGAAPRGPGLHGTIDVCETNALPISEMHGIAVANRSDTRNRKNNRQTARMTHHLRLGRRRSRHQR